MGKMVRAVLFAVMAVFSTAVFAEDEDPCASLPGSLTFAADGYYEIGTADALYKFACMVNGGATSINGRLTADICLNACGEGESVLKADGTLNGDGSNFTQWTPMNVGEGVKVTLNGNGKTISGLYFDDINEANVGLFGKVEGALSINNLGIVGSYFKGKRYVGGLVGRSFYGTLTIMNSYNVGTVCGDYVVGGLVGKHASYGELTIANSYNAGAVSGRTEIGGLVGYFDYYSKLTITNSYNSGAVTGESGVGGFVGEATDHSTLIITNSYNAGAVTGESGVGGFVGGIAFEEVLTIIENSYNVGTVSGTDDCVGGLVAGCSSNYGSLVIKNSYNLGAVSGHYFIGGLVATSAGCSLTIENSYNAGAVSGGGLNVGGLVGWNNSGAMSRAALIITNSYNAGTVRGFDYVGGLVGKSEQALTITNSYNAGAVSGSDSYVGGLVGESEEALTITNSFFLAADGIGGCNGKCPAYSGTGKSEEEFHNGDVVAELHNWCETEDGTETCKEDGLDGSVWGQDLNDVNSLPDFSGVIGTQHLLRLHTFEGDTRVYPTKYAEEYEFKLPTDLVRDGYVFVGWSTKEHAESVTDMVSSIATGSTGDLEFYAQWMKMNSEHVFEIASEEDLYEFAKWTNMGFVINAKLVENICVNACGEGESVLKADGTLNGDGSDFTQWTPIGTETQKFEGTFDGAGHTISGLYVDGAEYAGLFGYVFVDNINGEDEKGV
ncbi:MAG: InlB B-repeat-containing protein, partial [Fibrobacter sp.]|nr:InlB B-repeat-containing protein [Fibrobacter sp.]